VLSQATLYRRDRLDAVTLDSLAPAIIAQIGSENAFDAQGAQIAHAPFAHGA
jgi:hypothetical protein